MTNCSIADLRREFETSAKRSLFPPVAGMFVRLAVGIAGLLVSPRGSILVLLAGTGAIFPAAILIAKIGSILTKPASFP